MGSRLRSGTTNYHPPLALSSHKIIVSEDGYLDVSPKSHERSKRMGANTPPAYELKLWTTLLVGMLVFINKLPWDFDG